MLLLFQSELNMWYLDDGTLADDYLKVLEDFKFLISKSKELGLELNFKKCELAIISSDSDTKELVYSTFKSIASEIKLVDQNEISLLGCPLSNDGVAGAISNKTVALKRMSAMLSNISSHTAFFILKNSLGIPKLNYIMRCCPTWICNNELWNFDDSLRKSLEEICNTTFDNNAWRQSTLPVSMGGIGIRCISNLCYTAYLASTNAFSNQIKDVIPSYISSISNSLMNEALDGWTTLSGLSPIEQQFRHSQKAWDSVLCQKSFETLFNNTTEAVHQARLLASQEKESGAWLNA